LRDVASGKLYLEKKERRVESSRGGINYAQHGPVLLTQKHFLGERSAIADTVEEKHLVFISPADSPPKK
jgi:hypothetical protein